MKTTENFWKFVKFLMEYHKPHLPEHGGEPMIFWLKDVVDVLSVHDLTARKLIKDGLRFGLIEQAPSLTFGKAYRVVRSFRILGFFFVLWIEHLIDFGEEMIVPEWIKHEMHRMRGDK